MRKILIGALVATMFVAACGSSSKNTGAGSGSTTTTSASSSGGTDEFSQLSAKAKSADIKITFTDSDGKSSTYAQDGQGKTAYTSGDSTIIYDGTNTISCNGTGSDAKCTQLPSAAGGAAGGFMTAFLGMYAGLASQSDLYKGHEKSDNIAGRDASCVTFKASDYAPLAALAGDGKFDSSASVTICADKETGFLLKFGGTSNGKDESIFLATAVDKSSSADFEPPAAPETIPSFTVPSIPTPST